MRFVFVCFIFLFSILSTHANQHVNFEPTKVELSGHIQVQVFPGPPNYESIKNGDEIERHFYLALNNPVDVLLTVNDKKSNINSENIYNVKILQLVIMNENYMPILQRMGVTDKVKIIGTLFQRHTGHHHSRVLLQVEQIIL